MRDCGPLSYTKTEREFILDVQRGRVVFWVGAGVSMWSPTNLMSGAELKRYLLDQIFLKSDRLLEPIASKISDPQSAIAKALAEVAPEAIGEAIHQSVGPSFVNHFLSTFLKAEPNLVHQTLVTALLMNRLRGIMVTTNYDTCLEKVLRQHGASHVVWTQDDMPRSIGTIARKWAIIKPHGCATRPSSVVLAISREARGLSRQFARVLGQALNRRVVCLVGYSAGEPDLYPFLVGSHLRRIFVVARDPRSLRQNTHHVELLRRFGGGPLYGIDRFVRLLRATAGREVVGSAFPTLERTATALPALRLSRTSRCIIATRLLSGLNFCTEALAVLAKGSRTLEGEENRRQLLGIERYCRRELNEFSKCREITEHMKHAFGASRRELLEEDLSLALLTHDFVRAEQTCKALLRLCTTISDRSESRDLAARYKYHLARVWLYKTIMGQRSKAQLRAVAEAFMRYRRLGERQGNLDAVLEAERHLGRTYRVGGDTQRALHLLQQNLEQWRILGRRQGIINCLRDLGMAQYSAGQTEAAYNTFTTALREQMLSESDRYGRIKILWWLRRLASEGGSPRVAARHARELQSFLNQHRDYLGEWAPMIRDLQVYSGLLG